MSFNFKDRIILEDERAMLRPLEQDDLENLLPVATQHAELVKYSPYLIHDREKLDEYIKSSLKERDDEFRYPFIIYDKLKNAFAGSTSFANISSKDRRLEIGWTWIGRDFQRTGLNRHCKYLLLEYAFETLGHERVEFKTDERNSASRQALERLGAVYEGALRSHTLMIDGFRRTTVYYSILKNEWKEIKARVRTRD